jgi:tRNA (cmo5U34)-methyltransferase
MTRDNIFASTASRASDFQFDADVAEVFDDMLERSVPFYLELQHMIVELAKTFWVDGSHLYDLGCSTGTTLINLCESIKPKQGSFIGYDNSKPMLAKAQGKVRTQGLEKKIHFDYRQLNEKVNIFDASVVTMCWTLQFIRPPDRLRLIKQVQNGLREGGAFIVIDKVLNKYSDTNRLFIDLYYDFKKRNGYSNEEIIRKREALENVLVPYRIEENINMFHEAGFAVVETFFQWYNFGGFLCIKK